jgi:hypothetical protein
MFVLNCTKKLAKRLPFPFVEDPAQSTNKLGSWSANSFNLGRFPMILFTNDRTLMSVVIPYKEASTFHTRFLESLEVLLHSIALSSREIAPELAEMKSIQLTTRTNRSVLGSMNDFVFHTRSALYHKPNLTLEELSFQLSSIPCAPLKYDFPREAALSIFAPPPSGELKFRIN